MWPALVKAAQKKKKLACRGGLGRNATYPGKQLTLRRRRLSTQGDQVEIRGMNAKDSAERRQDMKHPFRRTKGGEESGVEGKR